ncbi:MAG: response regulator [Methanomicrobiales archaeon]|nr:response regulator [Methanomicrobiales archaeon]
MAYNILVVDDDLDTLAVMGIILRRIGYETHLAKTGREGLIHLAEHRPDLILLDLQMSPMDGWEFMKEVRDGGHDADVPIMLFTAKPLLERERRMAEGNVVRVLQKPISSPELKEALMEFFGSRRGR